MVASVNYSLNEVGAAYKLTEKNEEIRQALSAIILEAGGREYVLDEFAVTGDYAGGYLALMLALKQPEELEIPVRFAFVTSAPACFEPEQWNALTEEDKTLFVSSMTGENFSGRDIDSEQIEDFVKGNTPDAWVNQDSCR